MAHWGRTNHEAWICNPFALPESPLSPPEYVSPSRETFSRTMVLCKLCTLLLLIRCYYYDVITVGTTRCARAHTHITGLAQIIAGRTRTRRRDNNYNYYLSGTQNARENRAGAPKRTGTGGRSTAIKYVQTRDGRLRFKPSSLRGTTTGD